MNIPRTLSWEVTQAECAVFFLGQTVDGNSHLSRVTEVKV